MPKKAKEMSALDIKRATHSGDVSRNVWLAVGGVSGLLLQITPTGAKSWLLRTMVGDRRRGIGLGPYPEVTLAAARESAREVKAQIAAGLDPVEERKAARAALVTAQRRGLTFADAVEKYLDAKLDEFKNEKHRTQWRSTLETYAVPELGKMLVHDITVQDVLRVLEPIWHSKTETASRLRGRIESVLSWATVAGHRTGDNPARWAGNLKELLPAPAKLKGKANQPALQIDEAPQWLAQLRVREGMSNRALEFAALTATRSQEVRGALWEEIDLESALWVIPAARMKMDREHRIPLSADALALLKALPRLPGNPLVFPAARGGEMSDMALSAAMRRLHAAKLAEDDVGYVDRVSKRAAVPHGLRSTFRDWVAERTHFPGDMAEVALAHKVGNAVEAAYRRGDMVEKRRAMMDAWTDFLTRREGGKIVRFPHAEGSA
ncbi:integrase arm-type DNA-binding domain-containing protein [Thioclava sp. F36-7]|uniref:tyrosine-type recombinase/integrase n=1 Tax=Thioclava sp. F36-7 TaxID=1915317 RepID=UPI0009CBF421|nr:integrase arm-type DNA-binding domain-containing protein [Thioclava sp. F36-7]OOY07428.1 integrase [Thioclava sp. F36-7]